MASEQSLQSDLLMKTLKFRVICVLKGLAGFMCKFSRGMKWKMEQT